jgi:hypothetical protein
VKIRNRVGVPPFSGRAPLLAAQLAKLLRWGQHFRPGRGVTLFSLALLAASVVFGLSLPGSRARAWFQTPVSPVSPISPVQVQTSPLPGAAGTATMVVVSPAPSPSAAEASPVEAGASRSATLVAGCIVLLGLIAGTVVLLVRGRPPEEPVP